MFLNADEMKQPTAFLFTNDNLFISIHRQSTQYTTTNDNNYNIILFHGT